MEFTLKVQGSEFRVYESCFEVWGIGYGPQVKKVSGVKDLRHSFEIFARKALGHNLL